MDEHVPSSITDGLRQRNVDVQTVQEDGTVGQNDPRLLDRASELGRVIFSRDDDFLKEGARRQRAEEPFSGIIYAHQLRVTIGQCIEDLELLAGVSDPADLADQVIHLPLR
jgi:predicted nuclease of predicted toxin-antitoxin system